MWRPDNWNNINPEYGKKTTNDYLAAISDAFEGGADAMLEALRAEGRHSSKLPFEFIVSVLPTDNGRLVFIPDEEQDESSR